MFCVPITLVYKKTGPLWVLKVTNYGPDIAERLAVNLMDIGQGAGCYSDQVIPWPEAKGVHAAFIVPT